MPVDDGWPRVLQACKGDMKKRLLDQDKKGGLKTKEEVWFCSNYCNLCKRKSLQESVVVVLFFRCANDYIMAGSVFLLELGLIKG